LRKYLRASIQFAVVLVLAAHSIGPRVLAQNPSPSTVNSPKEQASPTTEKPASSADSRASGPIQPPPGYRVGVDDELMISVWHEPEFSQTVVVRPDGMITLPLLNDIKIAGLSTEELRALVTDKLKTVVNDPQVTIIVKAIRSLNVFLVGAVGKQGMYSLTSGLTVLELITQGGGLGPFAKSGSIYILRTVDGKQVRIGFNYKKAVQGKGDDPVLQSGDKVVVPQ
jgi:polysaccharide export outer membrane protein